MIDISAGIPENTNCSLLHGHHNPGAKDGFTSSLAAGNGGVHYFNPKNIGNLAVFGQILVKSWEIYCPFYLLDSFGVLRLDVT